MIQPLSWVYDGDVNWPRVLLVGLLGAVVVGIGFFAVTSGTAFGPYNPAWDGTSDLRSQLDDSPHSDVSFITETNQYGSQSPSDTVAIVLAPDEPYADDDAARVRQFVEDGGTLVVMENFESPGNALLADVGAAARIDGRLVRDEHHYDAAPTMPVANRIEADTHPLTEGVEQLTLNYASAIDPASATVLIRTSEFAYLTEDEDTALEDDTELDSYPVATVEAVGTGRVIAVSDPSIAINAMLDRPDNGIFMQRVTAQGETVLFDISHTAGLPPLTAAVLAVRGSAPLQILLGLVLIGTVALLAEYRLRDRFERTVRNRVPASVGTRQGAVDRPPGTMSEDQLAAYLRRTHPDWEDDRIRRVIRGFTGTDPKIRPNESHE